MRLTTLLAFAATTPAFAQVSAAPNCAPVGTWIYAGSGKGTATASVGDKSTTLEFAPSKKLNAVFDVKHLSDDGLFTLTGATSAIPGRDFDVKVVKGDDGSSSFSRPVTTTGQPFQVEFHTHGAVAMTVRNVKACRLR